MSFRENSWDIFWWFFAASVFFAYSANSYIRTVASASPTKEISNAKVLLDAGSAALKSLKESRDECWSDGVRGIEERLGSSARILPGR